MGAPLGNQNGKKAKLWYDALARALARKSGEGVHKGLDLVADEVVKAATNGERWAAEEIGNRFDGKPHQSTSIDGDGEGGPINHSVAVEFIERSPSADDTDTGQT